MVQLPLQSTCKGLSAHTLFVSSIWVVAFEERRGRLAWHGWQKSARFKQFLNWCQGNSSWCRVLECTLESWPVSLCWNDPHSLHKQKKKQKNAKSPKQPRGFNYCFIKSTREHKLSSKHLPKGQTVISNTLCFFCFFKVFWETPAFAFSQWPSDLWLQRKTK